MSIAVKPVRSATTANKTVVPGAFIPPPSYQPVTFSPGGSQPHQQPSNNPPSLPLSGPTDGSTDLLETYVAVRASIANSLPPGASTAHEEGSTETPDSLAEEALRVPTSLSGSLDMMAKHEWNLRSLDAVIVSANFLSNHINDMLWIKGRLLEHQGHILCCQNFAQRNLDAINRALYIDSKMDELRSKVGSKSDEA
jgi:hypothetical protein